MRRVVLHIDRLSLRGVAPADAPAVAGGLQAELQRLLGQPGGADAFAPHDGAAVLRCGHAPVPTGPRPADIGRAVAARVVRGGGR